MDEAVAPAAPPTLSFAPTEEPKPVGNPGDLSFAPNPAPGFTVPRNVQEVAGTAAASQVTFTDKEAQDLKPGILKYLQDIQGYGTATVFRPIWEKQMSDRLDAAKSLAEQAALNGDANSLNGYANQMQAIQQKQLAGPDSVEAGKAVVETALQNIAATVVNKYPAVANLQRNIDQATRETAGRNVLVETLSAYGAKAGEQATLLDKVLYFAESLLPTANIRAATSNKRMIEAMGDPNGNKFHEQQTIRDFYNYLSGLDPAQMNSVLDATVGKLDSPVRRAMMVQKLQEYSHGDAALDDLFKVLDPVIVFDGVKAAMGLYKLGAAVKSTAGAVKAANIVADDVLKNTNVAGLNESEKVAAFLSHGGNPADLFTVDVTGMSATAQAKVQAAARDLGEELRARLSGTTITAEEIKAAQIELRAKYDSGTNPGIHSVLFETADDAGQRLTVHWQSPDGVPFRSEEAAHTYAKNNNMGNYELVPLARPKGGDYSAPVTVPKDRATPIDAAGNMVPGEAVRPPSPYGTTGAAKPEPTPLTPEGMQTGSAPKRGYADPVNLPKDQATPIDHQGNMIEGSVERPDSPYGTTGAAKPPPTPLDKTGGQLDPFVPRNPTDPTGGWIIKQKRVDPYSYDSIGKYVEDKKGSFITIDPKHGVTDQAMAERVVGVHGESKVKSDLVKFIQPFYSRLSRKEKKQVFDVLEEGNSYADVAGSTGKEFNAAELTAKGLGDKAQQAYFATRSLRMFTWQLRNKEMARDLIAGGYREFTFTSITAGTGTKQKLVARQVRDWNTVKNKTVYDARTGNRVRVTDKVLDNLAKGDGKIAELHGPTEINGKTHGFIIHDGHTATYRDITTVLPYRPGEYSRIYTDEYFIRFTRKREVDGILGEHSEVVRTAISEREAKAYISSFEDALKTLRAVRDGTLKLSNPEITIEKLIGSHTDPAKFIDEFNAGKFDDITTMRWDFTRTHDDYLNGSIGEAVASGRPFYSHRGERIFSVDSRRANTKGVMDSLQAEITNISRVANVNQWREVNVRRWMNTFGDMIPNRSGNDVADFFKLGENGRWKSARNGENERLAERTHAYIMDQVGIKSPEEQMWAATQRSLTEHIFSGNERAETIGAWLRNRAPLQFMRNVVFNLTLGLLNPAQLIVQANGATTAIALSPLHGLKAVRTFIPLRMALMSDNPKVWDHLAKWAGMNSEDFANLNRAIHKAGFLRNMESTALYNQEQGAMNMFGNYGQKAWKQNTFFFNRGEEFSRVVSFDVARREWIAKNPGIDWTSDLALKQMISRADDFTQNMTSANRAFFQKGALAIPTQFLQYNLKLLSNIATSIGTGGKGKGFTRTEAASLFAAHLVMYGAAGNGIEWVLDEVMPKELKETLSPESKLYLSQGMFAGLINSMSEHFGGGRTALALGSRLGSFDWPYRVALAAYKNEGKFLEVALGPTAATAKRFGTLADVVELWRKDPDAGAGELLEGLGDFGVEQVSGLRNATKAYIYWNNEGKMTTKKGEVAGHLTDKEVLAQALGFPPALAQDVYNLQNAKKDHDATIRDLAQLIITVQKDALFQIQQHTPEGNAKAAKKMKLLQALYPNNGGDMQEVMRLIKDKIAPYDSQMQKLLGDHLIHSSNYEQPLTITNEPFDYNKAPVNAPQR